MKAKLALYCIKAGPDIFIADAARLLNGHFLYLNMAGPSFSYYPFTTGTTIEGCSTYSTIRRSSKS